MAIYTGRVTTMDYDFKYFDPTMWKLYAGWLEIKHLPKFAYIPPQTNYGSHTSSSTHTSSSDATESADDLFASPTSKPSRETRRDCDATKSKEGRDISKQQRQETRKRHFEEVTKSLARVSLEMQKNARIYIHASIEGGNGRQGEEEVGGKINRNGFSNLK